MKHVQCTVFYSQHVSTSMPNKIRKKWGSAFRAKMQIKAYDKTNRGKQNYVLPSDHILNPLQCFNEYRAETVSIIQRKTSNDERI